MARVVVLRLRGLSTVLPRRRRAARKELAVIDALVGSVGVLVEPQAATLEMFSGEA